MLKSILSLFSGIGAFLVGMKLVSQKLQTLAGGKVEELFKRLGSSRLLSIGVGVGSSAVLQSSSATTVILVSLVNSGLITLLQATCIIMGANVGTTFTALFISFNYLPIGEVFAFLTFLGAFIFMSSSKEKVSAFGWIVASCGLMFIGLNLIKSSALSLAEFPSFRSIFYNVNSPFILLLLGAVFTAIIQSSSALTGIVITFAFFDVMPLTCAFYLIMGGNVGSCATALLASLGGSINAKRTALINLIFNGLGVLIFLPFLIVFGKKITSFLSNFTPSVVIAYFHVVFNLLTTILLLPFAKKITDLSILLIEDKKQKIYL